MNPGEQRICPPYLARIVRLLCFGCLLGLAAPAQQITAGARRQMAALLVEKSTRTPAQQKMDSHLVHAVSIVRGRPVHADLPVPPGALEAVHPDARNYVEVDITAEVTPGLLTYIASLGGSIGTAFPQYRAIRARLPLLSVELVAARSEVRQIRAAGYGHSNAETRPQFRAGPGRLRQALHVGFTLGSDTSGDVAHQGNVARPEFSVDGTGIKVGVLSDGIDSAAAEQAAGRLSAVTAIAGQAGSGDEGTAMLEIVYTLAPGATLYFATARGGQANLANNIKLLANAGCQIILDDFTYAAEGVFQDDIVAREVEAVSAQGVYYFSDAQNSGSLLKGTSGAWEGDFADSGTAISTVPSLQSYEDGTAALHNFGSAANAIYYDSLTKLTAQSSSYTGDYELKWSDPLGASSNDYDLFILDPGLTNVLGYSTNIQNGSQNPEEYIAANSSFPIGAAIVIVKHSSAAVRALHLDTERGALAIGTAGATFGHNAAAGAFSIAAANVFNAQGGAFTGGSANPVESYSSDGPRRIFYEGNGTPITPGNFLISTNGGTVLNKPDLTAADGVPTGVPGYGSFFGTSAATPHVGAIAALALQARPSITLAQMRAILYSSALDIEGTGPDINSGAGIVMAPGAVQSAIAAVPALFVTETHTGSFTQGQSGSYTIVVGNSLGATAGAVTVAENLPAGLTLVSMSGAGWTCPSGGTVCTRSDVLAAGASYPPITAIVTVAATAASPQISTVAVSNGGVLLAYATDWAAINPTPSQLTISKVHTGDFTQGQVGATYTVTVSNASATAASGAVTVTENLPSGLMLISMAGTGWTCVTITCTRNDPLAAGAAYPSITVVVNVTPHAVSPQVNAVSVSAGGASASTTDPTNIVVNVSCSLNLSAGGASLPATGTSTVETCPNSSGQPNCGVTPHVCAFKRLEMLGYTRPRRANQFRQVLVPHRHRQAHAATIGSSEVFTQFEQRKRQALRQRAAHEIRATQMHQIPAPNIIGSQALKVCRRDAQSDLDEGGELNDSHQALRNRFTSKIIVHAGNSDGKTRDHSRCDHDHHNSAAFAITAGDPRNAREQDVGGFRGLAFLEDYAALVEMGDCQCGGESVQLPSGKPRNVLETLQTAKS